MSHTPLSNTFVMKQTYSLVILWSLSTFCVGGIVAAAESSIPQRLKPLPFKIAYESYVDSNWEIFVMNADGSNPVNLTKSPKEHEHYPQVSPDGTKICFTVDKGEGRDTIRSL